MRAKMRSPSCILSRSGAVCCGDVPLGVFLPTVPDFRLLPEGRGFPFVLVLSRIASRWGCVIGPPRCTGSSDSGTCRSPRFRVGGIGPPASSPAPLFSVRHLDAGNNLPQGAARVRVPTYPVFSVSLSFLQQGLGGMEYRFPAVVCGTVVFSEQSAGWENRPLSLERDFIDVMCPAPPLMPRSHRRDDAGKDRCEVRGLYRKAFGAQVADAGSFKAESRVNHPLTDRNSEHFLSRAGCGERARPTLENYKFAVVGTAPGGRAPAENDKFAGGLGSYNGATGPGPQTAAAGRTCG